MRILLLFGCSMRDFKRKNKESYIKHLLINEFNIFVDLGVICVVSSDMGKTGLTFDLCTI